MDMKQIVLDEFDRKINAFERQITALDRGGRVWWNGGHDVTRSVRASIVSHIGEYRRCREWLLAS